MSRAMNEMYRLGVLVRQALAGVCLLLLLVTAAHGQPGGGQSASPSSSLPPAVLTRDANGGVVVRATRVTEPIRIDGRLDEAGYQSVAPITELVQQEPRMGEPVSETTEIWVLFDDKNIYIACRCWDNQPDRIIANDMRRDSNNLGQHDHFGVAFDTFHDRRSGFLFYMTPVGGIRDALTLEETANFDWNVVWEGKTARFDRGWIAEMAFPFKSLRYPPGREQTWGIQVRRNISRKTEAAHLTPLSPAWSRSGIHRFSAAATLVGLEVPPSGVNLEIKPYAISRLTTDLVSTPAVRNDFEPDAGLDVKYGLTKGLTADLTYNTDFAQVEADEAQVNLTRFSLSFPEKRDFFLEGQNIFAFATGGGGGGGGGTGGAGPDAPTVFYSRRIGLSGARAVPVIAGGRLTGKVGPWSLGLLNMETDNDATVSASRTNFAVLRVRRDVLRRSSVGAIFTRRSVSTVAPGDNIVWGADGSFRFYENVYLNGYLAQSRTGSDRRDDLSYDAQFIYNSDRYGLTLDRLVVEQDFNPEVGFLRRENFRRNFSLARFSPRTANNRLVRKWTYQGNFEYITDNDNRLESRELSGRFQTDFQNSDSLSVQYFRLFEFLSASFPIAPRVRIPAGGYGFDNFVVSYTAGQQRRVSGSSSIEVGSFYTGDKTTATFRGRVEITSQLGVEPIVAINRIHLPEGRFTTRVFGGRTTFTMTPRMFAAALIQYQLERQLALEQHPVPLGIPAGQRVVRGLHGPPLHPAATRHRAPDSRIRREVQSPVPLLRPASRIRMCCSSGTHRAGLTRTSSPIS